MYIWLGIDLDNQLGSLKTKAQKIEKDLNFKIQNHTLPYHISLKISFYVEDSILNSVIDDCIAIYKDAPSFTLNTGDIENEHIIVWLRMKESEELNIIHDRLNDMLLSKYSVPLHEYDLDYKFHTTLFMGEDEGKIDRAYELLKNEIPPQKLYIKNFCIGISENGDFGTFELLHTVSKN